MAQQDEEIARLKASAETDAAAFFKSLDAADVIRQENAEILARAEAAEAENQALRAAANVGLSFLRHLTTDAKGHAGAFAEAVLTGATDRP